MLSSSSQRPLLLAVLCCLLWGPEATGARQSEESKPVEIHSQHHFCQSIFNNTADIFLYLYKELAWISKSSNIVFSPLSVTAALATLFLGTKADAHSQIWNGLEFNLLGAGEHLVHACFRQLLRTFQHWDNELAAGSVLFIDERLQPRAEFVQGVQQLSHTEAITINLRDTHGARTKINSFLALLVPRLGSASAVSGEGLVAAVVTLARRWRSEVGPCFSISWAWEAASGSQTAPGGPLQDPLALFRTNFREPEDAAQLINDHVRAETRGKITDLVRELKPSTQLVLANYIYFKALWEKPFILAQTKPQDFYVDESTVVQVPMMLQHQQHRWYLQDQHLACSVLRMDYKGGASALFVLPDRGKMAQVEEALTPGTLRGWDSLLSRRNFYKPLELHLPKFSISGSYLLNQILPKLGFTELVSPRADFSGISEREKLQVSRSFHKATLDIDEAGTEAAAATGTSIVLLSAQKNH